MLKKSMGGTEVLFGGINTTDLENSFISGITLREHEYFTLLRYYKSSGIKVPENLIEITSNLFLGEGVFANDFEKEIFGEVNKIFPDAKNNVYIDGLEVDIYIPSVRLIIEPGGIAHNRQKGFRKDMMRDDYFKKCCDIETIRIDSKSSNIPRLINFLQKVIKKEALNNI